MKNGMVKSLAFLVVSFCLLFASCVEEAETIEIKKYEKEAFAESPNKDKLEINFGDLSDGSNEYRFDSTKLKEALNLFYDNFKYCNANRNEQFSFIKDTSTLKISQLNFLYNVCRSIQNDNFDSSIAALRMHFAIENGKMILLFEPIYLKYQNKYLYIHGSSEYYRDSVDTMIKVLNYNNLIQAYQSQDPSISKVYINHLANPSSNHLFNPNSNDAYIGDIKSCILPIQQIERVFYENPQNTQNKINFSIVANNNFIFPPTQEPPHPKNLKLHVIAYLDDIGINNNENSYLNLGADFGQMDPPNKSYLYYKLFEKKN